MLTFTLGEKLGILKPKPVKVSRPNPQAGDLNEELCHCGRGNIVFEYIQGSWIPCHSVWDGGKDFGRLSFSPCCEICAKEDYEEHDE
ncbi:hypothetical protein LCGC14_0479300 [marine sediment metagenome]|uniref:Uncharacterized protein n=1 Tax=marine sediment metagenome TaxID=412755 RepID=A0A0F9SF00_9ZZZZ